MAVEYTICIVLLGVIAIGMLSGMLGVFVLLRGQGLLGDAIAHAALPGIALALLTTHTNNHYVLLCGGICSGSIGMALVSLVIRKTRLKRDAAQGIVLSIFFGCGLVLLTLIQKQLITQQPILNTFLFGNIATLLEGELYAIAVAGLCMVLCICLFWKVLVGCAFDEVYMHSVGFNPAWCFRMLNSMLLIAIVIGLQSVGVLLMSTLLIAPAVAARQWTSSTKIMAVLASCFGASSGIIGVAISYNKMGLPTGPAIIIIASTIALLSLLCAPLKR